MRCPACEAELPTAPNYCPYCGREVARRGPPEDVPESWETRDDEWDGPDRTTVMSPVEDQTEAISRQRGAAGRDQHAGRDESMRRCPRCGAANGPRRVRCGRCDADLATGRQQTSAAREPEPVDDRAESRGGRRLAAVLVLAALIGAGIGMWMLLRGDAGPAPQARFDPAVYTGDPSPLSVAGVTAEGVPGARALADGDPSTAVAVSTDEGGSRPLVLRLAGPAWVDGVSLHNGDQGGGGTGEAPRAGRILVRLGDRSYELHLLDTPGGQAVQLPEPVLTQRVEVHVLTAVPDGATEAHISEITLTGWPAVGADRP